MQEISFSRRALDCSRVLATFDESFSSVNTEIFYDLSDTFVISTFKENNYEFSIYCHLQANIYSHAIWDTTMITSFHTILTRVVFPPVRHHIC